MVFTVTVLAGGAAVVFGRAHGAREGGAPFVVLAIVVAVVIALDAVAQGRRRCRSPSHLAGSAQASFLNAGAAEGRRRRLEVL